MSYQKQIMELQGRVGELMDQVSELEHERMLREVQEQEMMEAKVREMALRMAREMTEAAQAEMMKEKEESLSARERDLEIREAGLRMKEDKVEAAVQKLQADKTSFDETKAELIRGIERKYEESKKADQAAYEKRIREIEQSFDARMTQVSVDTLEKVRGLIETLGKSGAEQSAAIAAFEKSVSSLKSESAKELAKVASKVQARSASRQRQLRYCVRKIFGSTSEKVRDDDVMALVDAVLDDPGLKITDELRQKAKDARAFLTRYNCRRELEKCRKTGQREEDDSAEKQITREYLESLPVHGNPVVLYPKEYLEDPSRFVEITSVSGRPRSYELVMVPAHAEARVIELPKFKERGNPESPVYQAKIEDWRPFPKSYASPELEARIEVEHFVDCDPLYTQEQRYSRGGLRISRQWMDKIHVRACDLLEPLFDAHYYDVLEGEYFLGDGSTFRIPITRPTVRTSIIW